MTGLIGAWKDIADPLERFQAFGKEVATHMPEFDKAFDQVVEDGIEVPLTFGQRAVGLTFNPSNDPAVDECKRTFANAIDQLNDLRGKIGPGTDRLLSIAITEAQGAQMWAVKALTWRE